MKMLQPLLTLTAVIGLTATAVQAEPLNVGDAAPGLKTTDQNGKEVDLAKELATGTSLVYFYPKADTPGCTKQACNLRDEFEAVKAAGIKVFGVSADTAEDQKKFAEKYTLPFTLLADKSGEVIKAFGVPTNPKGFSSRQSFLVRDGKVIWRDLKANPVTQAQDAIAASKAG
jgi:peroxiredoxin Q/BCP